MTPAHPAQEKLRVLIVTPELMHFSRGEVPEFSAALASSLVEQGADVRVLIPGYRHVLESLKTKGRAGSLPGLPGIPPAQLIASKTPGGVPLLIIESVLYQQPRTALHRVAPGTQPDDELRFGLLGYVGALLASDACPLPWRPQIVHCDGWQAGLAPAYLHFVGGDKAKTVFTAHRVDGAGNFPSPAIQRLGFASVPSAAEGVTHEGQLSFLKAGWSFADRVTVDSPHYARELLDAQRPGGMHMTVARRQNSLAGIMNGINTDEWDPEGDPYIDRYYNASRVNAKLENKTALQRRMGLAGHPELPLIGVVARVGQDLDLRVVAECATAVTSLPAQLVVMAAGDDEATRRLQELSRSRRGMLSVYAGTEESVAHQIVAGADFLLVPAKSDPGGVDALYGHHYGTPPIAHATGGLIDTVLDAAPGSPAAKKANGFLFAPLSADALTAAVMRAVAAYRDRRAYRQLQKAGMALDVGWDAVGARYMALYREALA
jgi:starch synthase